MKVHDVKIGNITIGQQFPPFIIAELSANHGQSLEHALQVVDAVARAGVHALKLQTYTPDTITLDVSTGDFFISDEKSLWKGSSLYDLYKKAYTPWEWHKPIFDRCAALGLIAFSTPFDETAVDFLEDLNVPCYKIASYENNHLPLIRKAASTKKPLIISTGMATVSEIEEAVNAAREAGCKDLVLLKCTSSYPTDPAFCNLRTIEHMRALFKCQVGFSDHTKGIGAAVASIVLGATVIEKHVKLDGHLTAIDGEFSLTTSEIANLVHETHRAWLALGQVFYGVSSCETSAEHRRSLYIAQDVKVGDVLTHENVRIVRPAKGLAPKFMDSVLGKKITKDAKKGTAVSWDLLG